MPLDVDTALLAQMAYIRAEFDGHIPASDDDHDYASGAYALAADLIRTRMMDDPAGEFLRMLSDVDHPQFIADAYGCDGVCPEIAAEVHWDAGEPDIIGYLIHDDGRPVQRIVAVCEDD